MGFKSSDVCLYKSQAEEHEWHRGVGEGAVREWKQSQRGKWGRKPGVAWGQQSWGWPQMCSYLEPSEEHVSAGVLTLNFWSLELRENKSVLSSQVCGDLSQPQETDTLLSLMGVGSLHQQTHPSSPIGHFYLHQPREKKRVERATESSSNAGSSEKLC